jgi:SAM-dependent methyltransferase
VLRRALSVQPHEHVLDIGCGSGLTTREAALTAQAGSALGVDICAPAVERAREIAQAQGVHNITFEHADAQVHPFPKARFNLAMSRFGTMFFGDPVAAFANVGGALRPGGRLVMMVWQARDRNEWDIAIRQSLAGPDEQPAVGSAAPDPFSLADPAAARAILEAAGFADVTFADVDEPMYFGPDAAAALDWIGGFASTRNVLSRLDPVALARALGRLREALAAHSSGDGVWFGSSAWIVTARPLNSDME